VSMVTETVNRTLKIQQQTQKAVDAWEQQRQEMISRLQNLKMQEDLLRYRQHKLQRYITERQAKIAGLEKGIAEQQVIARELEPFLDQTLEQARTSFRHGLPFLQVERRQRFAELESFLSSYESSLAEKLRRVLEMLQIEAQYGHQVEAYDRVLELSAVKTTVNVLRLGSIGLYYLTLDGKDAGWYNPKAGKWETLPGRFLEPIKEGLRMAMKQRAIDLVKLPVDKRGW
ncbi:MAG: DUF3450 domain-containing protein, partial [Pseudomonadota bacterium]|nr:DUF3450 domain-containing protein [Pseudomonadota bacterium]